MKILGIDEAGRGPVIGPMIVCGVVVEEDKLKRLEKFGLRDSKKIAPRKRSILARKIKRIAKYHIVKISAGDIDKLRSKGINLNEIEKIAITKIIKKTDPDIAIIDSLGDPERFANEIEEVTNIKVIAEHNADDKYAIVAAASIIAKVERDAELDKIKKKHKDIGSGYPSDKRTQAFLRKFKYEDLPEFVRKSWATVKRIRNDI